MSLNAYVWAGNLPLDLINATAFRVLLKMADVADQDGRGVWLSRSRIAEELGCSIRTVQRALNDLKLAGLIAEGDKRAVSHIRSDRRPVVYDLKMSPHTSPQFDIDGVTESPIHGVTKVTRRANSEPNGVTTGVTQYVTKPSNSFTSSNYRVATLPTVPIPPRHIIKPEVLAPCTHADGHTFKFGVCLHCNQSRESLREATHA